MAGNKNSKINKDLIPQFSILLPYALIVLSLILHHKERIPVIALVLPVHYYLVIEGIKDRGKGWIAAVDLPELVQSV